MQKMATKERSKGETGIHGKYYERGITTWIALKCLSDKSIQDYWIHSNPPGIDKLDDIILYVKYKTGEDEVLFFQLKHKEKSGFSFHPCRLEGGKKFRLSIYEEEYFKITDDGNPIWKKLEIKANIKKSFCLFTNCVKTEEEEKFTSAYKLQLIKVGEINDIADTSIGSEIPSIYKVYDPEKHSNEIFLGDFYLWLNQIDEDKITERITTVFRINATAVESLRYFFVRRFEPQKRKDDEKNNGWVEKLTRKEMIRKMLEIFLEDYQIPRQVPDAYDRSLNVLKIINSYNLTLIKQTYSEKRIWSDILCEIGSEQGIGRGNEDMKKLREVYLNHVCKFEIPFFIRTSNPLFESFQNYFLDAVCMSTVIFLDDKKNVTIDKNERKVLEFITDLTDDLIEFCSPHSPKISFQGKERIDLLEFVKGSNKPNQQLDIDVLFKYINQTIIIGQDNISPDYYIKRTINVPVMKLEKKPANEIRKYFCLQIFFNCPSNKGSSLGLTDLRNYISSSKQNRTASKFPSTTNRAGFSFFCTSPFSMTILEQLYTLRKGRNRHIHIFEKVNNADSFVPVYREGYGDCYVMKKMTSKPIDDGNIINFCEQNKMNIICENAGEGKTMLLKHISSHFPPDVWAVKINLSNASNLAVAKDFNIFVQEIYNSEKRQTLETYHDVLMKIYRICLDKKKVIWLVDDYEEIETPQLTDILRALRLAGMKTWITSRPFRKNDLEMDFGISAMQMIPITPEEQTSFFENYLAVSNGDENTHEALKTIDAIREKMNKTFIGVFQQMTMLAEIFKLPEHLSNSKYEIIDLYEKFIELKLKSFKAHQQEIVKIMMQKFALMHFFSDVALSKFFDMTELYAQMKFFKQENRKGSIITFITDDNRVIFSHETYAEYLGAQWLAQKLQEGFLVKQAGNVDNLENMKQIIKLLFIPKLRTFRYFFDAILTQKLPMLSAAVNRQYELMELLYRQNTNSIDQRDILGRTLLHFLIGNHPQYGMQSNVTFLRQLSEFEHFGKHNLVEAMDDFIMLWLPKQTEFHSEEHQFSTWFNEYHKLKHRLVSPCNLFQKIKDSCWNLNLDQFILMSGSLELLDKLISEKQMILYNVEREQKYLLFTHGIINKFNNTIAQMDISDLNVTRTHILSHSYMSLLHLSISFNNWETFQILLRLENNLDNWNSDINDNTVLHTACEVSDTRFMKALCQGGRFSTEYLNRKNIKGLSSFHCLCCMDSDQWVEELINRPGLDFDVSCNDGNTPLISSVISGNSRVAEILYLKGANVNHQNKNGFSALHYACIKNFHDCVQQLIEWNANIDLKNKYGITPLLFAVKNDNKEIVTLLIDHNADVNIADRDGCTALHHAVKHNNIELLAYLIDNGAKVGYKNKKGWTPMRLAKSMQNHNAISVMLPYE